MNIKNRQQFGARLKELRIRAALTQRGLATKVGVTSSYLSKIEHGVLAVPSASTISKIASILKADANELLSLAGKFPYVMSQRSRERAILEFGPKLTELRKKSGLSQLELARKANVDPSYISKLENGKMPPPSGKVLLRMAKALRVSKDELITTAGKTPNVTAKKMGVSQMFGDVYRSIKRNVSVPNLSPLTNKGWVRVAISVLLVVSIAGGLWLASPRPAQAVDFTITPATGTGNLGQTYQFDVQVNINSPSALDVLPIQMVDISIENVSDSSKAATLLNLPLVAVTTWQSHTIQQGSSSGSASILVTPGAYWMSADIGNNRYGYGYGYSTGTWDYLGPSSGTGYGYGYSPYTYPTNIKYTIRWTTPPGSDWAGTYRIKPIAYILSAGSGTWTAETPGTVTLSTPTVTPTSAPSGDGDAPVICKKYLSDFIDEDGKFTSSLTFLCPDCDATISIPEGTVGLTEEGEPLSSLTVTSVSPPTPPPGYGKIGLNFDFEPSGATFDPPILLTFEYNPNWLPPGATPENLTIAYYDEDTGRWVELGAEDIEIDPVTNTITARVSHFTVFSVLVHVNPAAFEVSGLKISPTSADVAEKVNISATVANTGDLAGSYEVVLKINGKAVGTKKVSIAGGDSEQVTFTTVQGQAGSYSVSIDGLSGKFTITAAPTAPIVIAPSVPQVVAPEVVYPAPTAPTPPAVPAPVPAPTPWLAIIIALVVTGIVAGILVWYYGFRRT